MFRLHLDIPLEMSQDEAIQWADNFKNQLKSVIAHDIECWCPSQKGLWDMSGKTLGIRLSNDDDRGNKNLLDINGNGHASSKKLKIVF